MIMAERIVSLSWRLTRVERMRSKAIDVMTTQAEMEAATLSVSKRAYM
ncbi:MAG: hypothetical protein P8Z79_05915 [Sedimentisphaerales bacterium]